MLYVGGFLSAAIPILVFFLVCAPVLLVTEAVSAVVSSEIPSFVRLLKRTCIRDITYSLQSAVTGTYLYR
jgi:hypothetical protein